MKILPSPRILMILALLSLGAVFLFPLWQILLDAAQFPGGLQLHIWINKISGTDKYILQNINILNHYIGMKPIHPDSIPELKYFPIIVYGLLTLGVVVVVINKAWAYLTWPVLISLLGILGIYDFYLWLYDYGHNLDPTAPIKVEGMTYQPPLFGDKDLLNFYVQSYPHWGAAFLGLAVVLAFLAYIKKIYQPKMDQLDPADLGTESTGQSNRKKGKNKLFLAITGLVLVGCSINPEPIAFGKDHCAYCKMSIADPKFGAELVTAKGRVFKFDALECMVPYMQQQGEVDYAYVLGIAYDVPGSLHSVDSMHFVIAEKYNSPMGANLAGFKNVEVIDDNEDNSALFDWESLKNHLNSKISMQQP